MGAAAKEAVLGLSLAAHGFWLVLVDGLSPDLEDGLGAPNPPIAAGGFMEKRSPLIKEPLMSTAEAFWRRLSRLGRGM